MNKKILFFTIIFSIFFIFNISVKAQEFCGTNAPWLTPLGSGGGTGDGFGYMESKNSSIGCNVSCNSMGRTCEGDYKVNYYDISNISGNIPTVGTENSYICSEDDDCNNNDDTTQSGTDSTELDFPLSITSEDSKSVTAYKVSLAYPPTVSITANPITVLEGKTTKITWTPIGAKTCTAISPDTGYDTNWPGSLSATDGDHTWTTGSLPVFSTITPYI